MKHIFLAETGAFDILTEKVQGMDFAEIFKNYGRNIISALIIIIIGFIAVKFATVKIKKALEKTGAAVGSARIVDILIKVALYFVVLLMAASALGIPTNSVLALFSAFALSFSLALKDTLALVASGLIIVISKPFVIGDLINVPSEEVEGRVGEIGLIHTHLFSPNNREIVIPNSVITSNTIINYSRRKTRRIDAIIPVFYTQDIQKAKAAVLKAVAEDDNFLKDPAPFVGVAALNQSSVDLICKAYVSWEKYDELVCELNEVVFAELCRQGIEVPYNQLDVHIK